MVDSAPPHEAAPVGFFPRVLAISADSILETIYVAILLALAGAAPDPVTQQSANPAVNFTITYLLPIVVTVMFWSRWQATPGKLMIRARIVDAKTGGAPTTGQYIIRYFGYIVSLLPLGLGFLWVLWDRRKQGWHDKMAGTMVVRVSREHAVEREPQSALSRPLVVPAPVAASPPVGTGPWANPEAAEGEASLIWFNHGTLHLAEVAAQDLPGASAAICSGASFPALAVPLGTIHRASWQHDSGNLLVTYGDGAGQRQEAIASFRTPELRGEFLYSLRSRLGPAWTCTVEQGSRWKGVWDLICLAAIIGLCTIGLQYVADQMHAGVPPEIDGETAKQKLAVGLVYVLAAVMGSDAVGVIGGVLLALCAVAFPFVLLSPPRHSVLQRVASV